MNTYQYPIEVRATAVESLLSGITVVDVARGIGCSTSTVSRWYLDYRGYQGQEGITITLQHKSEEDLTTSSNSTNV